MEFPSKKQEILHSPFELEFRYTKDSKKPSYYQDFLRERMLELEMCVDLRQCSRIVNQKYSDCQHDEAADCWCSGVCCYRSFWISTAHAIYAEDGERKITCSWMAE